MKCHLIMDQRMPVSFVPGVPGEHKYPEKQSKGTKKTKLTTSTALKFPKKPPKH